jgi:hypothetical protein
MSDDVYKHQVAASAHALIRLFDESGTTVHDFETLREHNVEDYLVWFTVDGDNNE